jgi:hypothetical protein
MEKSLEPFVDLACTMAEVSKSDSPLRHLFLQVISAWDKGRSGLSIGVCDKEFKAIAEYCKEKKWVVP